ncbi:MAG: sodium:solute symporter [Alloprevotella sp.]|nr:sodium:solute symporter [Alloprevotella sp.]
MAILLTTLVVYFAILSVISFRSRGTADNDAFFRAQRRAPWTMVALGMVGASVSGVSLVSVPGWVGTTGMTYLQMCMGFVPGYLVVAFVLLPLYYRLRLTSIYGYLGMRFGSRTHRTGALFFLLSKLTGAAARLYLAVVVLTQFLPGGRTAFILTSLLVLLLIYLYTRAGGLSSLVRTDALQTVCLLLAIGGILWGAASRLGLDFAGTWQVVCDSPWSRVFEWEPASRQNFWRQFASGLFIVVVMTGLDQDMMQKNLSCRTLREAQKNMCSYGLAFLPVNALLLGLGVLLYTLCQRESIQPPTQTDALLPSLIADGTLGTWVVVPFAIGIVAAAFSSADSALTSLTTSFCVDLLGVERRELPAARRERLRRRVHVGMCAAFFLCMMIIAAVGAGNMIDVIYLMATYTYGPLLGLFAFGMFTRRPVRDRLVPVVCLCGPLLCWALDYAAPRLWGFSFGYELLLVSGLLTVLGLLLLREKASGVASADLPLNMTGKQESAETEKKET